MGSHQVEGDRVLHQRAIEAVIDERLVAWAAGDVDIEETRIDARIQNWASAQPEVADVADARIAVWAALQPEVADVADARIQNWADTDFAEAVTDLNANLSDHEALQAGVHGLPADPAEGSILIWSDASQGYVEASLSTLVLAIAALATQAELDTVAGGVGTPNTQTANYTLALADAGKSVEMNSASPLIVTVPENATVAFPVGTIIEVARLGAGSVTIHPASGTVIVRNSVDTAGTADRVITSQYTTVSLRKRATNEWILVGAIT